MRPIFKDYAYLGKLLPGRIRPSEIALLPSLVPFHYQPLDFTRIQNVIRPNPAFNILLRNIEQAVQ